jgi:hypothetical protein
MPLLVALNQRKMKKNDAASFGMNTRVGEDFYG